MRIRPLLSRTVNATGLTISQTDMQIFSQGMSRTHGICFGLRHRHRVTDPIKAHVRLGRDPLIRMREICNVIVAYDLKSEQDNGFFKSHDYDLPVTVEN